MKYYIMFGPPGAGKGTHASAAAVKYNLHHISTGELLRAEITAGTELGLKAKSLIDAGNLVPDEVVEGMIESRFNSVKDVEGFLLDGFPRTIRQAEDLDKMLEQRGEKVTAVISLCIPDEVIYKRLAHRAQVEGRADDASPEIIANRIENYHKSTEPLIDYFKAKGNYHEVDGNAETVEINRARVFNLIDNL